MASPMQQFEIKTIAPLSAMGYDISFTNSALWMAIAVGVIGALMFGGLRHATNGVPGRAQAAVEITYRFIANMLEQNAGSKSLIYAPYVFSIFMFVLICNLLGLLPFIHPFTPTSHIAVTATLAALVFSSVIIIGLMRHGLHFFDLFNPKGVPWVLKIILVIPIEIISFLSRPVTLSIRLFANMTAGHVLLKVFGGFIVSLGLAGGALSFLSIAPLILNILFTALELLVAVIQAYVFALLTSIYLNDAINLH